MSVTTQKYVRKPFEVDAIQVTEENMSAVMDWCLGEIVEENGVRFIKVKVPRVLNERQTKAFVGDWVLHAGGGFKVYMSKAFAQSFDRTGNPPREMKTTSEKLHDFATTDHTKVAEVEPPARPVVPTVFVEPVVDDAPQSADPYRRQPTV